MSARPASETEIKLRITNELRSIEERVVAVTEAITAVKLFAGRLARRDDDYEIPAGVETMAGLLSAELEKVVGDLMDVRTDVQALTGVEGWPQ
jgi:hypothetical protein